MRHELALPDFDLPGVTVRVSGWLAAKGARVVAGDRLLEVVAGEASIDLSAPATGVLVERCVEVDDVVQVGQLLAGVESEEIPA
jgi:pyruvate/2-oxoglutarate dehydrogenase complex dihydrolipoamide acyltransferase (E2) component